MSIQLEMKGGRMELLWVGTLLLKFAVNNVCKVCLLGYIQSLEKRERKLPPGACLATLRLSKASHKGIPTPVFFHLDILQKGPFFLLISFLLTPPLLLTFQAEDLTQSWIRSAKSRIHLKYMQSFSIRCKNTIMAVLLAVALFSVMLANGLSASPQHSRYFGLDLLLDAELLLDPGLAPPVLPWPRDFMDSLPPPVLLLPFLLPLLLFWLVFS